MKSLPRWLQVVHWVLIAHLLINIFYGSYQIFVVMVPEGAAMGPLWGTAKEVSFELLASRRLYAIEVWVCTVGLAVYLGVTEVLPRRLGKE